MTHTDFAEIPGLPPPVLPRRSRRRFRGHVLALLLLLAGIGWLYAGAVDTDVLGFIHDDGVYAITGKALAEGHGFRLLHVPGLPAEIKYPFVYPGILAGVWWVDPAFPHNLPLMSAVSIGFALAALALCHLYFTACHRLSGWLSLLAVTLFASDFFWIYFATAIMAEAPYLFFSMLTLLAADFAGQRNTRLPGKTLALLVGLSALTFLTRATGLALMIALVLWLMSRREWKNALIYGAGALTAGVLPWRLWTSLNTPALTTWNYPLVNTYSAYGREFLHNLTTGDYLNDLSQTAFSLMSKTLENMLPVFTHLPEYFRPLAAAPTITTALELLFIYALAGYYLLQAVAAIRRRLMPMFSRGVKPQPLSLAALYLFCYLLLITLWNYEDQMARFILAVTPLLWLYFFKPMVPALRGGVTPTLALPRPGGGDFSGQPHQGGGGQDSAAGIDDSSGMLRQERGDLQAAITTGVDDASGMPCEGSAVGGRAWPKSPKKALAVVGIALLTSALVLIPAVNSYKSLRVMRTRHWIDSGRYPQLWPEYQEAFAWVKGHLPKQAVLAASSDVVFYLYTGRPTFYVFYSSLRRVNGVFTEESYPLLMQSLDRYGVRYLVAEPHMQARTILGPVNKVSAELLRRFPERFQRIYSSPQHAISIYRIRKGIVDAYSN